MGTLKRQRILIDAIKRVSAEIDVLVYVHHRENDTSEQAAKAAADTLAAVWGGNFHVTLCRRAAPARSDTFWHRYIRPAASFFNQEPYDTFAGPAQIAAFEHCLENAPDYVFIHRLNCMPPALLSKKRLPPVFFDLDDIEHVSLGRSIGQPPLWPGKRLDYLQVPILAATERRAVVRSQTTFVCSEVDRAKLVRRLRVRNVQVILNAAELRERRPLTQRPTFLLLGSYSYPPNRAGADFFLDRVWPLIRAEVPCAEVTIAGPRPEMLRHFPTPPAGASFPGFVHDLDALYDQTRIAICPILSGAGTRVKIIEAAAYGKPIVSTVIGAEGIDLRDDHEILLCDSAEQFAAACIELIRDDARATALGDAARRAIESRYDRRSVVDFLANCLSAGREGKG
jgi:glycosyltransferase involved in cell wall biosynthesis